MKLAVILSMEAPLSGIIRRDASFLYLSFLMWTQRFIIGVGHLLDSAILHIGLDTEFFQFVESLTEFALNCTFDFSISCSY